VRRRTAQLRGDRAPLLPSASSWHGLASAI
jgi:hypothetical protein